MRSCRRPGSPRRRWVLGLAVAAAACSNAPEAVPPLSSMRLLDPDLVLTSLQGQLHLRVFPRGALRCDMGTGQVRDAAGARALAALPGRNVAPRDRCGAAWAGLAGTYGTASPVDTCFDKAVPTTVNIPDPGTYIVLVHGQGDIPLPNGGTQPGILGAGCAEVTLSAGQTQSVTVSLRQQLPMGTCGNGVLDFDETCDLGAAMNNGAAGCLPTCQTAEQAGNTTPPGDQHRPAVLWAQGQRLVVAFEHDNNIYARYFSPAGAPEALTSDYGRDLVIASGRNGQANPRIAPAGGGFVASWETLEVQNGTDPPSSKVAAGSYDYRRPPQPPPHQVASDGADRQQDSSIAAGPQRVLVVWQDVGTPAVRMATAPVGAPLGPFAPSTTVTTGPGASPRVVTLADGSFLVVWAAGGIVAQHVDPLGTLLGPPLPVTTGPQDQPALAALPDGRAVVAFRDTSHAPGETDGAAIRWTLLTGAGMPTGGVHVANSTTAGDQSAPAVVVGGGTGGALGPEILFAWEDWPMGQDTGPSRIRARLRRPDDSEVLSRFNGTAADFSLSQGDETVPHHTPAAAYGGPSGTTFVAVWDAAGIRLRTFPL